MYSFENFLEKIDKVDTNKMFNKLKKKGHIREEIKQMEELNEKELEEFKKFHKMYHIRRRKNWRMALVKSLRYNKRPFLENSHLIQ